MYLVDDIKARIDIIDLVSETVKLRRSGKSYSGFCPFHPNSRTPAFVVFPESATWRCFGQCNEGGDIFHFVMKKEGWDFPQALQYLAQRAGVELQPLTPARKAADEAQDRLRTLLEETVTFFQHHLLQTPAGEEALAFLHRRGLEPSTIETFGLGYAPPGWEAALQHFLARGYSMEELLKSGIVTERQGASGVYDRFRNRVMFPIRDMAGLITGFGARVLDPNDIPKFLNSPQTGLFDKSRLLYGLDLARKTIRSTDQVVIVEGYLDVIVLHQAGFANTVSPMGTALTEDQLRTLKRFTRRIVLALDADAAGEKATLRGLELARQAMDRTDEIAFDARGLLRHEARLQADLRVTTIPAGMDPDEVVLRNPQEWRKILENAQPVVVHVMETLAAHRDLEDAKVKSEIAAQVLPLIEDVPDSFEREAYRQRLARLLRVDERSLIGARPATPTKRRASRPAQPGPPAAAAALLTGPGQRARDLEAHALRLLWRQPDALYLLDRALQQAGLNPFNPSDLDHYEHQTLARLIQQALAQDNLEWRQYIMANLPDALVAYVEQLKAPMQFGEPTNDKLFQDLVRTILRLRSVRLNGSIDQMRSMQEDLQQHGEQDLMMYHQIMVQYTHTLARLNRAFAKPLALD
ncbi:MAG TPA: DNA primase [Levilinea sp.]|nr:DNA primase [Levilinea sp.]